jgi:hypothetical protein
VSCPNQRANPFKHLLCGGENGEVIAHHQDHDATKGRRGKRVGRWARWASGIVLLGSSRCVGKDLAHGGWPCERRISCCRVRSLVGLLTTPSRATHGDRGESPWAWFNSTRSLSREGDY